MLHFDKYMSEQQIASHRQRVNEMKYQLMVELYDGDEDELNSSRVYNDLKRTTIDSINRLRALLTPPIEVRGIFDRGMPWYSQPIDVAVRCVLSSLAAIFEILGMMSRNYDTKLCAIIVQLQSLTNNSVQHMYASGMLETAAAVIREGVMNLNAKRIRFVQGYKQEIVYCIKCALLSFRSEPQLVRAHLESSGLSDVLEVCIKNILDDNMLIEVLNFAQLVPGSPPSLLVAIYDHISNSVSNARDHRGLISMDCLTANIVKCYKAYQRDTADHTSAIQAMFFTTHLSSMLGIKSWTLHSKSKGSLKQLMYCMLDITKTLTSSQIHTAELITKVNSRFMSDVFRLVAYILSKRPDLVGTFILRLIPTFVLTCKCDVNDTYLKAVFSQLEASYKWTHYLAATLTESDLSKFKPLMSRETSDMVSYRAKMYQAAVDKDVENKYIDHLSGCFIVSPALLQNGSAEVWVDALDMEMHIFRRPENPYTRERLTLDDFWKHQIANKDKISAFNKDRKGFLAQAKTSITP